MMHGSLTCGRRVARGASAVFVCLLLLACGQCFAAVDQDAAQDAADQSLSAFPWYDAEKKEIAPVEVRKTAQPKSKDVWVGKKQNATTRRNWQWPDFWRIVQAFIWCGFAILIGVLLYFFTRSFIKNASFDSEEEEVDKIGDAERMENLPFPVRKPRSDLLSEARSHYEAGNYREAIIYLFSYQLVQLDKNNLIRLTKGKTNRQYVRELGRGFDLKSILSNTMLAFEDVFFGDYPLERGRFESCWNRVDEFHRLLNEASVA